LVYLVAVWYSLWPFGIVRGHLVYFPVLVCLDHEKSGNPDRLHDTLLTKQISLCLHIGSALTPLRLQLPLSRLRKPNSPLASFKN
jgi:hypothetical protein